MLPPPRPRLWPIFVTFVVMLPVAGVAAAITLIAVVGLGPILRGDENMPFSLKWLLATSAATELVLVGAVLVAARPFTLARLRLQGGRVSPGVLVAASLGAVALSHVLDTLIALLDLAQTGTVGAVSRALQTAHGSSLAAALAVVAVMAGFAEELFFRGYMQTRFAERWKPWMAVLVAAAFFGLMHMDLVHAPLAFALGLWLGFVCERSGSLWPAVLAHVTNNAVATLAPSASVPLYTVAIAVVLFAGCAVWLVRALPRVPPALVADTPAPAV
jgi:uncharacterized protein